VELVKCGILHSKTRTRRAKQSFNGLPGSSMFVLGKFGVLCTELEGWRWDQDGELRVS
jgi:hypothetical protein